MLVLGQQAAHGHRVHCSRLVSTQVSGGGGRFPRCHMTCRLRGEPGLLGLHGSHSSQPTAVHTNAGSHTHAFTHRDTHTEGKTFLHSHEHTDPHADLRSHSHRHCTLRLVCTLAPPSETRPRVPPSGDVLHTTRRRKVPSGEFSQADHGAQPASPMETRRGGPA